MFCLRCGKDQRFREVFCNMCGNALNFPGNNGGGMSKKMDSSIPGFLCYFFLGVPGLYFFLFEKKNTFIRFHAVQSMLTFGSVFLFVFILKILSWVSGAFLSSVSGGSSAGALSSFFGVIYTILLLCVLVLWMFLILKAYQGEIFKLPFIGDMAEDYAKSSHS